MRKVRTVLDGPPYIPTVTHRSPRTPTLTIVATQAVVGVVIIVCSLLSASWAHGDEAVLMYVCMGSVGGLLLGVAFEAERHRRAMTA